jgi:hypothetical protein
VRKNLNFWPPFPIVLTAECEWDDDKDNIPATLEHHDRVCDIKVWNISCLLWEKALPLLQKPFPILTDLNLRYTFGMEYYVVPDLFLGGSATRLRNLRLEGIPFPGLPKLLFSATHLVHIELYDIPDSGFVAPEAMVTCISTLTRLESLTLWFESPRPHPEWERRRTSSPTCALRLLPSLTCFSFKGVSEYLEDIVDSIDAPQLKRLRIKFFHQPVFDTPRLSQFISRVPKLKTCNEARMRFDSRSASVKVLSLSKKTTNASLLLEECYYRQFAEFQLSPMVQFCNSSFPQALFPTVEDLIIVGSVFFVPPEEDGIDPSLWRELLQPFTAVKDLYLHPKIASRIALALQDLAGGSVLELFPVMQNIFLKELWPSGLVPEGIEQFVAARQLAGRPISVSCWERKIIRKNLGCYRDASGN